MAEKRNASTGCVQGIGEIALRVSDLDQMQQFYAEVIGLELMQRFDAAAFFRIADGVSGHTQVLALFDRSLAVDYVAPRAKSSTVDHIAFAIDLADFGSELERLRSLGLKVTTAQHAWVKWRSLYVNDPEENVVELVCFDPSIGQGE